MRRVLLVALPVLGLAAVAAFLVLRDPTPEAVDLTAPAADAVGPAGIADDGTDEGGGGDAGDGGSAAADVVADPSGTWTVRTDLVAFDGAAGAGSWVGYRIDEELATVGAFTAVGRTPDVGGTVVVAGTEVLEATITADLSTLTSDSGMRDGQVRRRIGDRPTSFELSGPLAFEVPTEPGAAVVVDAPGRLRIGEVERDVVVVLAASLDGDVLVVRGAVDVTLADFDVVVPRAAIVLSVADVATVELQLLLTRD